MFLKKIFLFGLLFLLIGGTKSQIPQSTVYELFNLIFESAFGLDSYDNARVCPGICMPSQTAIFCPGVLDQIQCYTPNTLCCVRRGTPPFDGSISIQSAHPLNQSPNTIASDLNKSGMSPNNSNSQNDPTICPGDCIQSAIEESCKRPAVIIPNTSDCVEDTICCDNSRVPVTQRPTKPRPRPTTQAPSVASWTGSTDTRKECPGICIANLVRFTCYGNAETTDLFRCRRPTTVCCASREIVLETLFAIYQNEPIPLHGSHGHDTLHGQKIGDSEQSDLNDGEELSCPGVCVENQFAGYCEAYLVTSGICETGTKCCVSKDKYSGKITDLRTPIWNNNVSIPLNTAQLIALINKTDATTKTSKPAQVTAVAVESELKKVTVAASIKTQNLTDLHSTASPKIELDQKTEKQAEKTL